jgi:hypothetical protein
VDSQDVKTHWWMVARLLVAVCMVKMRRLIADGSQRWWSRCETNRGWWPDLWWPLWMVKM